MYKVVLINPAQPTKYPQPPMGLAIIAAILEREGYPVTVVEANALNLRPEDVVPLVADADVVGLTAMTPTIGAAITIAQRLRQAYPGLTIILGGAHATLLPEETLSAVPDIDLIVRGEGEETIIELIKALENKRPVSDISGISYREDGKVVSTAARTAATNLDSLPFLAYHLLPLDRYKPHPPHGRSLPFSAIITSRGCPYRCSYCSKPIFGNKFIGQNPERVVEEIAYYTEKFGIKELAFYDDVFTLNRKRAYAIADGIIGRGLNIDWTCETRVNLVDKELLRQMKRAGCYAIAYGIESATQKILDTLNKDITLEQVEEAIKLTRETGIQTIGYFMIGSPEETPETISSTIEFAKKLKLDYAQFAVTIPFPGTRLYELYLKSGGESVPWENFVYEGTGNSVTPMFITSTLNRTDLQVWASRAYKDFYLRPSYLWQQLRRVRSPGDLRVSLQGLSLLMKSIRPVKRQE